MNVTAHQKRKENEETKTGMKKAGERRRQSTDLRKAVCCPSVLARGQYGKIMVPGECLG